MSLATDYLLVRGIIDSTITALGFELDPAPSVQSFNDRLHRKDGQRLLSCIKEGIWFPCLKNRRRAPPANFPPRCLSRNPNASQRPFRKCRRASEHSSSAKSRLTFRRTNGSPTKLGSSANSESASAAGASEHSVSAQLNNLLARPKLTPC